MDDVYLVKRPKLSEEDYPWIPDFCASALEGLPHELVWMIIEYAPDTVHELRLVRNYYNL